MLPVAHQAGGLQEHASSFEGHFQEVECAYVGLQDLVLLQFFAGYGFPEVCALGDFSVLLIPLLGFLLLFAGWEEVWAKVVAQLVLFQSQEEDIFDVVSWVPRFVVDVGDGFAPWVSK